MSCLCGSLQELDLRVAFSNIWPKSTKNKSASLLFDKLPGIIGITYLWTELFWSLLGWAKVKRSKVGQVDIKSQVQVKFISSKLCNTNTVIASSTSFIPDTILLFWLDLPEINYIMIAIKSYCSCDIRIGKHTYTIIYRTWWSLL